MELFYDVAVLGIRLIEWRSALCRDITLPILRVQVLVQPYPYVLTSLPSLPTAVDSGSPGCMHEEGKHDFKSNEPRLISDDI
jgi:hypothetical protein